MRMKYRLVIFDFDGTLADSFPFFIRVFNQLADQHGFKGIDPDLAPTYRSYDARQIMEQVGIPAWKLPLVAKSFISLMRQNAASISLFDHTDDMLLYLANKGVTNHCFRELDNLSFRVPSAFVKPVWLCLRLSSIQIIPNRSRYCAVLSSFCERHCLFIERDFPSHAGQGAPIFLNYFISQPTAGERIHLALGKIGAEMELNEYCKQ